MDFLELNIAGLSQSKKIVILFLSIILAIFPLPPSLQKYFHYFYNALGTFAPKFKILA